jgi:hypothetical protein
MHADSGRLNKLLWPSQRTADAKRRHQDHREWRTFLRGLRVLGGQSVGPDSLAGLRISAQRAPRAAIENGGLNASRPHDNVLHKTEIKIIRFFQTGNQPEAAWKKRMTAKNFRQIRRAEEFYLNRQ